MARCATTRSLCPFVAGQLFDIKAITAHVHKVNAALPDGEHIYVGWDLAHGELAPRAAVAWRGVHLTPCAGPGAPLPCWGR